MINFNEPILVEKAFDYVREAINDKMLCGDGEFTKRCNFWLESWAQFEIADEIFDNRTPVYSQRVSA